MEFCRELAKVLHYRRYHTYRADRSPAGYPDECYVKAPFIIFSELKTELNPPSDEQVKWLDDLAKCTAYVYLWRPSDMISDI